MTVNPIQGVIDFIGAILVLVFKPVVDMYNAPYASCPALHHCEPITWFVFLCIELVLMGLALWAMVMLISLIIRLVRGLFAGRSAPASRLRAGRLLRSVLWPVIFLVMYYSLPTVYGWVVDYHRQNERAIALRDMERAKRMIRTGTP